MRKPRVFRLSPPGHQGRGSSFFSSRPATGGQQGPPVFLPMRTPKKVTANVFILTGFMKPRSLEVGERIFSFHKYLNSSAEAAGAYLVIPLSCLDVFSALSAWSETGY